MFLDVKYCVRDLYIRTLVSTNKSCFKAQYAYFKCNNIKKTHYLTL